MNIEMKVGDLTYRLRIVSDLLDGKQERIEYGPLSLKKEDDVIRCTDFDGRVYTAIEIPRDVERREEIVKEVVGQVDEKVETVFEEL